MMCKYSVVVAGAGNAGLTASLRLAMSGRKVLLIEQHNIPGGCATSFRRGRFEFEASLHELSDLGPAENPGELRKLFDEFGVKINWYKVHDCFRAVGRYSDGTPMDVTLPAGVNAFINRMEEYVPGSRPCMEDFFALTREIERASEYSGKADPALMAQDFPNFLRTAGYPAEKVFDALKFPRKVKDIMSSYWSYLGVDLGRLSFTHYASMIHMYVDKGAYIPSMTSHEISLALLERFRELGGEAWFNCRAEEFLFDGDRCCGVRTTCGDVYADYVLANINPHLVNGKMVPKELVPEREKKLTAARTFSVRPLVVYFALNKSHRELGIEDYSIFIQPGDSVKAYRSLDNFETNDLNIFLCYNVVNSEFSPEGTCVVSFTSMFNIDRWANVEPEDYFKVKSKFAAKAVVQLKECTGIDISDCIEEMCVATPWTFARYLGTPEGCVYGYELDNWDSILARRRMIGSDYPIKGLKTIGAAGPNGDGYSPNYESGDLFAKLVLMEMNGGSKSCL
jgi:prolycopene isomerase